MIPDFKSAQDAERRVAAAMSRICLQQHCRIGKVRIKPKPGLGPVGRRRLAARINTHLALREAQHG